MIAHNVNLRSLNSFHLNTTAAALASFHDAESLKQLLTSKEARQYSQQTMILGGGSNILFTKPFEGLLLKNEVKGIELIREDDEFYYVKTGGGETWHQFVMHAVNNGWAGIENLSLIPGSTGAAPIQNIGAYGVEMRDTFYELEALHLQEHCIEIFDNPACAFGYRDSVFKHKYRGQFAILNVTWRLNKHPRLNTSYGAIGQELESMGVLQPDLKSVSQAVINIRRSKLPDPDEIGNAGSFFKNPVIPASQFEILKLAYPKLPGFPSGEDHMKVPAAWLIEQCNWKGYRSNDAGVHALQPLVLVNYGNASGMEIFELSEKILQSVNSRFGITLEREVNIC